MSIVIEDGTGLANAEAFCSVAFADTYLAARGLTLWATMSTAEKEQALRRAADCMEQWYRNTWAGTRVNSTQALSWPRYEVPMRDFCGAYYPSNAVPAIVQQAQALLAFKAAAGDLSPDVERMVLREKIGPLETEYSPTAPAFTRYRAIDNTLSPLLRGSAGSASVVRT